MPKRKTAAPLPQKSEAERRIEDIQYRATVWQDKAEEMRRARTELIKANMHDFVPAIEGFARALEECARGVDDAITGDDCPF